MIMSMLMCRRQKPKLFLSEKKQVFFQREGWGGMPSAGKKWNWLIPDKLSVFAVLVPSQSILAL